jgi:hypothetical protein
VAEENKTTSNPGNSWDILQDVYQNPFQIFAYEPVSIEECGKDCIFVLDTNVLLIPFETGKQPLQDIEKIYTELANEQRLVIPAQVAREFAANRATKLTQLFQQLSSKRENIKIQTTEYPLLESLPEYQSLREAESKAQTAIKEFQSAVDKVIETVRRWRWNDPVSSIYRGIFSGPTIAHPQFNQEEFTKEAEARYKKRIPPGYKDQAKSENPYGDLLIWKTIVFIGQSRKKNVIFVSGDEKPDWWHQSNNVALYPRYELVEEFRRESDGKTFHIVTFADFLQLRGAAKKTVDQVGEREKAHRLAAAQNVPTAVQAKDEIPFYPFTEEAISEWLSNLFGRAHISLRADFGLVLDLGPNRYGVKVLPARDAGIKTAVPDASHPIWQVVNRIALVYVASNRAEAERTHLVIPTGDAGPLSFHIGYLDENYNFVPTGSPFLGRSWQ